MYVRLTRTVNFRVRTCDIFIWMFILIPSPKFFFFFFFYFCSSFPWKNDVVNRRGCLLGFWFVYNEWMKNQLLCVGEQMIIKRKSSNKKGSRVPPTLCDWLIISVIWCAYLRWRLDQYYDISDIINTWRKIKASAVKCKCISSEHVANI